MSAIGPKRATREALKTECQRLQLILDANKLLSSTLDLVRLTEIMLEIIRQQVPVDRVTAFMMDRDSKVLRSVVAQGVTDFIIRLPINVGIAGIVARSGRPLDVPDVSVDPQFCSDVDRLLSYQTRDIYCMPLLNYDGKVVGVLELMNRTRPIEDGDKRFLNDIAVHIGLALELAWEHREVLEKRRMEAEAKGVRERLVHFDRLRLMEALFQEVMHELNNPLAVLVGNVGLLKLKLTSGAYSEADRYIEKIEAAADRSAASAGKFLKFLKESRTQGRMLDLPEVLRRTVALLDDGWLQKGIEVKDELQEVPALLSREEDLQQMFLNILKNAEEAIVATGRNGRITLRCRHDDASQSVLIDIADTGAGIPTEMQDRIFQPFFSTKPTGTGTGMGLIIAQQIVEEHRGKISFETEKDAGTTFTIGLPLAPRVAH